jgi:uncharacterized protein
MYHLGGSSHLSVIYARRRPHMVRPMHSRDGNELPATKQQAHARATSLKAELLEGHHKFELTEAEVSEIFTSPVYRDVISSAAFQRLKRIHFLGSLDYVVDPDGPKPSKRHTRYQHSLGVARLALQFARDKALSKSAEELCVVSALLHDIRHAPLSHSLESVFKKEFGIGHHVISERIIKGDAPIGAALYKILRKWNINPFEVLAIISGNGGPPHRELFNYAINIDTIEAILRSSTYLFRRQFSRPPSDILTALLTPDSHSAEVLDNFWKLKHDVYSNLIQHRVGVLADFVCQHYMERFITEFERDDYYFTESHLEEKHPELFSALRTITTRNCRELLPDVQRIPFVRRSFVIDSSVPLEGIHSINVRYRQRRTEDVYNI